MGTRISLSEILFGISLMLLGAQSASANQELAKKLSNPIANLTSVPLQFNFDENIGVNDDGSRLTLNAQPVIPFELNSDWHLISRTIVPLTWNSEIPSGSGQQFGVGDIVQSFFFSPSEATKGGWVWGVGPVLLIPSSSSSRFGTGEWGVGATGVALRQSNGWTVGALANHIVDVDGKTNVNATYLQPFISYTTPNAWTFSLNTESTYDWTNKQWSVPVHAAVSKLTEIGGQPVSFQFGLRQWAESAPGGAEGLGFRFAITFLFPQG